MSSAEEPYPGVRIGGVWAGEVSRPGDRLNVIVRRRDTCGDDSVRPDLPGPDACAGRAAVDEELDFR